MEQRDVRTGTGGQIGENLSGLVNGLLSYIRTRSPENWLFFAAGIVVGLLVS